MENEKGKEKYGLWYHVSPYLIYLTAPAGAYTVDGIQAGSFSPDIVLPFAFNHLGGTAIAAVASLVCAFGLPMLVGYITDPNRLTRDDRRTLRQREINRRR